MTGDNPDSNWLEDELEITDLRPGPVDASGETSLPGLPKRGWQRAALGLGLALMVIILLGGPLSIGEALPRVPVSPTLTEEAALPPVLAAPHAAPTALAGIFSEVPALRPRAHQLPRETSDAHRGRPSD